MTCHTNGVQPRSECYKCAYSSKHTHMHTDGAERPLLESFKTPTGDADGENFPVSRSKMTSKQPYLTL
eukprot:1522399-Amphidinium_carterae.1